MSPSLRLLATLALAAGIGACHVHIDDPGTDPRPATLDYPAGIAMDPGGRFVYVSNGNADLRYGGGTLMMLDTHRVECAIDAFRGLPPDPSCAAFPTASDIAVTRDEDNLPITGCVADPIDPQIVDCVEKPFALANSTIRVGNFAGTMRIRHSGDPATSTNRTIYLAVRGDPSITYLDVDLAKITATPDANGSIDRPGVINCVDDPSELTKRDGYDPATNLTTVPPLCDKSHLIQTYTCTDRFGCAQGDNDIPSEPFNMFVDEGTRPNGTSWARLLVAHLAVGEISLINLLGTPVVADVSPPFYVANQSGRRGVFGIARRDDPVQPIYYLTSNLTAAISTFHVTDDAAGGIVVPGAVFSIGAAFSSGADGRELVFEPGGQRAFMTQNAPPSVAVLDTRINQPEGRGLPSNKVVDTIQVCQGPSHLAMRQAKYAGPAGTEPLLQTSLYVICFTSNQIMIVDPDRPGVNETILVGRGPNELVFNFSGEETPAAQRMPAPRRRRAYLTNYSESTIAVLDLEPGSSTENRMIARIGLPLPIPTQ